MPKRKHNYDYLEEQLKKLKRKIKRRRKESSHSSSSSEDDMPPPRDPQESELDADEIHVISESAYDAVVPGCSYWNSEHELTVPIPDEAPQPAMEDTPPTTSIEKSASLSHVTTQQVSLDSEITNCNEPAQELDPEILDILGQDPTTINEYGMNIQKDLAIRLCHIATTGLPKEIRKDLKEKYLVPENCKTIKAPTLNPEIRAALLDGQAKRDKAIENKQTLTSCALSSLSQAITLMLASNQRDPECLKKLMDTARILADIQHYDSVNRRSFILSSLKKDLKDQLEKSQIDETLFGNNLPETLKSAKIITKSGAELRLDLQVKQIPQRSGARPPVRSLNFRAPPNNRRAAMLGGARSARVPTQSYRTPAPRPPAPPPQPSNYRTSSRQQPPRHRR